MGSVRHGTFNNLIDADLWRRKSHVYSNLNVYTCIFWRLSVYFHVACSYLAEVMPVESEGCLGPELKQMELCSEDLLASCHGGQVEQKLDLITSHCGDKTSLLNTDDHFSSSFYLLICQPFIMRGNFSYVCRRNSGPCCPPVSWDPSSRRPRPPPCCTNRACTGVAAYGSEVGWLGGPPCQTPPEAS